MYVFSQLFYKNTHSQYDFYMCIKWAHLTPNLFLKPTWLIWQWEINDVKSKIENEVHLSNIMGIIKCFMGHQ